MRATEKTGWSGSLGVFIYDGRGLLGRGFLGSASWLDEPAVKPIFLFIFVCSF